MLAEREVKMDSKILLLVLLVVISFLAVAQSAPFPNWEDTKPDYFLQPQEVAPTILSCYECTTNCSTVQTTATCKAGFSCYTLQAFDAVLNESVLIKGCIPAFFCTDNRGCSYMNQSLGGALGSCSITCCHVSLCNPGAITAAPSLATTSPPTTTPPPPTTTPPPPTTTPAPTTTAPPTTLPTTLPTTVPTTIPTRSALCGGPLASPTGYFASPNYPRHYPNNAYCVWTVTVPLGSVLKIDFLFFETEECYDFLEIYVGRRLVRYLTGDDIDDDDDDDDDDIKDCDDKDDKDYGKDIFSWYFFKDEELVEDEELDDETVTIQGTGEMIRLVFSSDRSVTKRGFFAKYSVMQAVCGGPLPFPSGSFSSPGYPGNYPDDVKCVWTITVPPGSVLEIEFRSFETEICDDYLKILQGGRKVRRLSGVYSYGLFGWGDDDDDCDDDGDDGDDDDNDDKGDGDGYNRRRERVKRMFGYPGGGRFGFPMRSRHVPPYVIRVTIRGTGELISIIFKSDDDDDTEKGFEAVYRVSQGAVFG